MSVSVSWNVAAGWIGPHRCLHLQRHPGPPDDEFYVYPAHRHYPAPCNPSCLWWQRFAYSFSCHYPPLPRSRSHPRHLAVLGHFGFSSCSIYHSASSSSAVLRPPPPLLQRSQQVGWHACVNVGGGSWGQAAACEAVLLRFAPSSPYRRVRCCPAGCTLLHSKRPVWCLPGSLEHDGTSPAWTFPTWSGNP